jgi:SAM-dependent methyltransferase
MSGHQFRSGTLRKPRLAFSGNPETIAQISISMPAVQSDDHSPKPDPKQGEREYFARIGEAGRLHAMRKPFSDDNCNHYLINISVFLSLMRPAPARIVEFGCGTGWLSLIFAERGYEVVGVDISPDAIAIAEQLRKERQIPHASFQVADYEEVKIDPPADYVDFSRRPPSRRVGGRRDAGRLCGSRPGRNGDLHRAGRRPQPVIHLNPRRAGVWRPRKGHAARKIIHHARAAGFRRHMVLPWAWDHMRFVYRPAYARATSPSDLRGRKFLGMLRVLRNLFRHRAQGIVLLWKK